MGADLSALQRGDASALELLDGSQLELPPRVTGALVSRAGVGDVSRPAVGDVSRVAADDALAPAMGDASLSCSPRRVWCRRPISESARVDAEYCGRQCRQAHWRLTRRRTTEARASVPMHFAYADPPYIGCAKACYGTPEVDHRKLIRELETSGYDGWALSCSAKSLRVLLPMCPESVEVCPWVKPHGVSRRTRGRHNAWEAVIVNGGRERTPGIRDWLRAMPARGSGELLGRKPVAFSAWLFDLLGMSAGDHLADLFPGTRAVGRAWLSLSPLNKLRPEFYPDPAKGRLRTRGRRRGVASPPDDARPPEASGSPSTPTRSPAHRQAGTAPVSSRRGER